MDLWLLAIVTAISQFSYVYTRAWNIIATSKDQYWQATISNIFVWATYHISAALGIVSASKVIMEQRWDMIPIVLGSLIGSILATHFVMTKNKKLSRLMERFKKVNLNKQQTVKSKNNE